MSVKALILILTILVSTSAVASTEIVRSVIGTGAVGGIGPTIEIRSTLGQDVAGIATSIHHTIHAGFWGEYSPIVAGSTENHVATPLIPILDQNAPNPFNPLTVIGFSVPGTGGEVRLTIYAADGRLVRTLVASALSAGRQTVFWDGRDDGGRSAASGVYVYKLEVSGAELSRKMVLVR